MNEIAYKLATVRRILDVHGLAAVRLRGVDWFSWATGGGSSVIILTSEAGVGEVLITPHRAFVLTNAIERDRFRTIEVPDAYEVWACPWQENHPLDAFVKEHVGPAPVASDRPMHGEQHLPESLVAAKRRLVEQEVDRYRNLGRDAAEAMTDAMLKAEPSWTEYELAGEGAKEMWRRGIHPTLTLVAGENSVARYRHPFPTFDRLGSRAMLVFCGRRHGLYANLTRFVHFEGPTPEQQRWSEEVAFVESTAFAASRPGTPLREVYRAMAHAYDTLGVPEEILKHHQGGTTGYLSREVVATPTTETVLEENTALAWNPSLAGAKIEDTVLMTSHGIEVMTVDPRWPTEMVAGRARPQLLVKA